MPDGYLIDHYHNTDLYLTGPITPPDLITVLKQIEHKVYFILSHLNS